MTTWEIPEEPPSHIRKVWDKHGREWERGTHGDWHSGMSYQERWCYLLDNLGPISDHPPPKVYRLDDILVPDIEKGTRFIDDQTDIWEYVGDKKVRLWSVDLHHELPPSIRYFVEVLSMYGPLTEVKE